jgi:hypothetical protein
MPYNLLKKYNELLELAAFNEVQRKASLLRIFNRDIAENPGFGFRGKRITPTPQDGVIKMETLFAHLTTEMVDKETRQRIFEIDRSLRLHWLRHHVEENVAEHRMVFSVEEPEGVRTYIYDRTEKYVIVLEPLRKVNAYFLLSAHYLKGKDEKRNKMEKKYKRKLPEVY